MSSYYGDDVHVAGGNLQTVRTTTNSDGEGRESSGARGNYE